MARVPLSLPPTPRRSINLKTLRNVVAGVRRSGQHELQYKVCCTTPRVVRQKYFIISAVFPGEKGCAGEDQQQFRRSEPYLT
jgi:hypothetical protein